MAVSLIWNGVSHVIAINSPHTAFLSSEWRGLMTSPVHVLSSVCCRGCIKIFAKTWRDWVIKASTVDLMQISIRFNSNNVCISRAEIRSVREDLMNTPSSGGTSKYFLNSESYIKAAFVFRECVPDSAESPQNEIRTEWAWLKNISSCDW